MQGRTLLTPSLRVERRETSQWSFRKDTTSWAPNSGQNFNQLTQEEGRSLTGRIHALNLLKQLPSSAECAQHVLISISCKQQPQWLKSNSKETHGFFSRTQPCGHTCLGTALPEPLSSANLLRPSPLPADKLKPQKGALPALVFHLCPFMETQLLSLFAASVQQGIRNPLSFFRLWLSITIGSVQLLISVFPAVGGWETLHGSLILQNNTVKSLTLLRPFILLLSQLHGPGLTLILEAKTNWTEAGRQGEYNSTEHF